VARKGSPNSGRKSFLDEKTQNITKINLKTKQTTKVFQCSRGKWHMMMVKEITNVIPAWSVQGGLQHRLLGGTTL